MSVTLKDVYRERKAVDVLYELLAERTPDQSISHKQMPQRFEHNAFVRSRPYLAWYLVIAECESAVRGAYTVEPVGSIYLSRQREIGVFIFRKHQRKGYARAAINELRRMHPGDFYANVAPDNEASHALWRSIGARVIQHTYAF